LDRPWFGWGRWNRNRVYDGLGKDAAPTDGLWGIELGIAGIVGLSAFTIAILLPPLLVWTRCPLKYWDHPGIAPAAAMSVLLSLYMLDNILNAMPDPIFTLALGGLAGIAPSIRKQVKAMRHAPQPAGPSNAMEGFGPASVSPQGMRPAGTFR
jgi:O-antigen ligase